MPIRTALDPVVRVVVALACLSTVYLYLYPLFQSCAFPATDGSTASAFRSLFLQHVHSQLNEDSYLRSDGDGALAPFRLLVLADPQLEGDSSLPKPEEALSARLRHHWRYLQRQQQEEEQEQEQQEEEQEKGEETEKEELVVAVYNVLAELWTTDIPRSLQAARKRLDLVGNDYYLAHIFRTLKWWAKPSHVTVLGDLIGSQWVSDGEFQARAGRFWNRVFSGGERVDDSITSIAGGGQTLRLPMDDPAWTHRIINIAGNHDIGYAGDVSRSRLDRFERFFGAANWDVRFDYPSTTKSSSNDSSAETPNIHLIVLNNLVLDQPALDESIRQATYDFLNGLSTRRTEAAAGDGAATFTLLLTHVPLHKPAGVCVDAPYFSYWGDDDGGGVYKPNGLKEQNHLSKEVSESTILKGLFGGGRHQPGLILTGHDHHGCDTWHSVSDDEETAFDTVKYQQQQGNSSSSSSTGIREVTLRSMMGDFGGNAGLLSAWFDAEARQWRYQIQMCAVGVQHVWWAVHVLDLIALALLSVRLLTAVGGGPAAALPAAATAKAKAVI